MLAWPCHPSDLSMLTEAHSQRGRKNRSWGDQVILKDWSQKPGHASPGGVEGWGQTKEGSQVLGYVVWGRKQAEVAGVGVKYQQVGEEIMGRQMGRWGRVRSCHRAKGSAQGKWGRGLRFPYGKLGGGWGFRWGNSRGLEVRIAIGKE